MVNRLRKHTTSISLYTLYLHRPSPTILSSPVTGPVPPLHQRRALASPPPPDNPTAFAVEPQLICCLLTRIPLHAPTARMRPTGQSRRNLVDRDQNGCTVHLQNDSYNIHGRPKASPAWPLTCLLRSLIPVVHVTSYAKPVNVWDINRKPYNISIRLNVHVAVSYITASLVKHKLPYRLHDI